MGGRCRTVCASDSDSIRAEERTWERDERAVARGGQTEYAKRAIGAPYRSDKDGEREVGGRTKRED